MSRGPPERVPLRHKGAVATVSTVERKGVGIDSPSSGDAPPKRKRGRPRDPGADRRILVAARAVAGEMGVQGTSMSAIAARSGVGKPTIYLRWANRRDLMAAAVADLGAPIVAERSGSARADLLRCLLDDRELLVAGECSRFLRAVLFEVGTDPALAAQLEETILGPRRRRLMDILELGVGDGQIRGGIDLEGIADLLSGPLMRAMVVGGPGAVTPEALRAHVDVIVDGIGVDALSG